jgi:hypothetical protein
LGQSFGGVKSLTNQKESSAREARNAYMREWRAKNKDKVKATQDRYWKRKAEATVENESK